MSETQPTKRTPDYSYSAIDKDTLYPGYPSPDEYDLSAVHFRSETRKFARDVYENGFGDRRRINKHAAVTVAELLSQHYEEIYDVLSVTTTRHDEKVIIENKKTGAHDTYTVGSFTYDFVKNLPMGNGGKRYYCNCFRDEMKRVVNKIINEVHKMLAGIGIPAKQL